MTNDTHTPPALTRRLVLGGGAALTLSLVTGLRPGLAQTASETVTMEGMTRYQVGSQEVFALLDGRINLPVGAFSGASEEELRALIDGQQAVDGFINAYAVRGPDNLVLVDAGGGSLVGPTAGRIAERLSEVDLDPGDIDVVLATHLHPDHIGGLIGDTAIDLPEAQLVVHENEIAFWTSDERMQQAGEGGAGAFQAARAVLERFGERVTPIAESGKVPGGMELIELPGHTPGHTGFYVRDGNEQLLIWGDIIHAPALQFPRPDVTIGFDVDPEQARATRARVLDIVTADAIPVAGMHHVFPGIGQVTAANEGYAFEPLA